MQTDIQGIRALAMYGAWHEEMAHKVELMVDSGLADTELAGDANAAQYRSQLKSYKKKARRVTPLLKYVAAEQAVAIARTNVQIHGGVGYTKDYGAEKLLRDAMVFPIYEGTSQIQALMAMKDTLGGILKNPRGFIRRLAQTRWRSMSASDPLEKRLAKLQLLSFSVQQHLVARTAADKGRALAGKPISEWPERFFKDWDPKRDFAFAMLHAERLTQILADVAICEVLYEQARRFPDRREVLVRYIERAEPRCRYNQDRINSTGDRLLAKLTHDHSGAQTERKAG